jgi:hypothetical protein
MEAWMWLSASACMLPGTGQITLQLYKGSYSLTAQPEGELRNFKCWRLSVSHVTRKYEDYSESNPLLACEPLSLWAVNKRSNGGTLLYIKITYKFPSLVVIFTAGIEALVASQNKLLYVRVTEICRLWAPPCCGPFHQLLIIVEFIMLEARS